MRALRLQNLRSLVDTGWVELRPITVLVGKNSSGKSTFARTFPLLKQSIEKTTDSPVLWFGKYVDFGSIEEATRFGAEEDGLSFGFTMKLDIAQQWEYPSVDVRILLQLTKRTRGQGAFVSRVSIEFCEYAVAIAYREEGQVEDILLNGEPILISSALRSQLRLKRTAFILPTFDAWRNGNKDAKTTYAPYLPPRQSDDSEVYFSSHFEIDIIENLASELAGGSEDLADAISIRLRSCPVHGAERMREYLNSGESDVLRTTKRKTLADARELVIEALNDHPKGDDLLMRLIAAHVPELLSQIDNELADFISRIAYMGPMRVRAERYHRVQDLAVDDVDYQGENLAMFLQSLSEADLDSFSQFTTNHYGFDVRRRHEGAHVQVLIRTAGAEQFVNLVDVGFGYSQLLPLLALLWSTCARERKGREGDTSLVVLEQPELHLHPGHQARIADLLVGAIEASRARGKETRMLVESHSEALVNRLGDLIQQGKLKASDVQIALFDHDQKTRTTSVRLAHYDEEGSLVDWPFGFFAPLPD